MTLAAGHLGDTGEFRLDAVPDRDDGRRLSVLALEPRCGPFRRETIELVSRHSRHEWDWRTLPDRRPDRRLAASAAWFAADLERRRPFATPANPRGRRADVLVVGEAIHLGDFVRLARPFVPEVGRLPTVLWVGDHGLPAEATDRPPTALALRHRGPADEDLEAVYLLTAAAAVPGDELARGPGSREAAGEAWFASTLQAAAFLTYAESLYARHRRLFTSSPLAALEDAARVVAPPVPVPPPVGRLERRRRRVAVSAASDPAALAALLKRLVTRGEAFELVALGENPGLAGVPHVAFDPRDADAVARAMATSGAYLVAGDGGRVWFDPLAVAALRAGCGLVAPADGSYEEVLPAYHRPSCLHDGSAESAARLLTGMWHGGPPEGGESALRASLAAHNPATAVAAIDARLDRLAAAVA